MNYAQRHRYEVSVTLRDGSETYAGQDTEHAVDCRYVAACCALDLTPAPAAGARVQKTELTP